MGKAMAHMAVVFAELERDFIRSRTRGAGRAARPRCRPRAVARGPGTKNLLLITFPCDLSRSAAQHRAGRTAGRLRASDWRDRPPVAARSDHAQNVISRHNGGHRHNPTTERLTEHVDVRSDVLAFAGECRDLYHDE